MIESNKTQTLALKYGLITFGTLALCFSILMFYNPEQVTDWAKLSIGCSIGLTLIVLNIIFFNNLKRVKVNHSRIVYEENGEQKDVNWSQVTRVGRIRFVTPVHYYARIDGKLIIFTTETRYGYSEIGTDYFSAIFDHSKMGAIIRTAKEAYGN